MSVVLEMRLAPTLHPLIVRREKGVGIFWNIVNIIPQDSFTEKSLKEGKKNVLERIGENNMEIKFCVVSEKDLIRTKSSKVPFVVNKCQSK